MPCSIFPARLSFGYISQAYGIKMGYLFVYDGISHLFAMLFINQADIEQKIRLKLVAE